MDILEYLRSVILKPPEIKIPHRFPLRQPLYETVPIRLDSERTSGDPTEYKKHWKELYVEKADGVAFIRLTENSGDIELKEGLILYSKIDVHKWYLSNEAQADKEIKLILTKDIDFFLREQHVTTITQLLDILEAAKIYSLPADRITIGVLKSADGTTYFDLVNNLIKGKIEFIADTSGYAHIIDKPTALGDINVIEGAKLEGIEAGADVTKDWNALQIIHFIY